MKWGIKKLSTPNSSPEEKISGQIAAFVRGRVKKSWVYIHFVNYILLTYEINIHKCAKMLYSRRAHRLPFLIIFLLSNSEVDFSCFPISIHWIVWTLLSIPQVFPTCEASASASCRSSPAFSRPSRTLPTGVAGARSMKSNAFDMRLSLFLIDG